MSSENELCRCLECDLADCSCATGFSGSCLCDKCECE